MACSSGALAKLAVEEDVTFDSGSTPIPILYEDIKRQGSIIGTRGITGSREQFIVNTRTGPYRVGGRFAFHATPNNLDVVLPWILGANEAASDTFKTDNALQDFYIMIDRVGSIFKYGPCNVSRAIFRAQSGPGDSEEQFLEVILEVEAYGNAMETGEQSWGTIPAFGVVTNDIPYMLTDSVLTINSDIREIHNFVLVIDNHLAPRWVNTLYPSALCPQDRTIMLRTEMPFTSDEYTEIHKDVTEAGKRTGVTSTLVFTNGSSVLTFTFANLQYVYPTPNVPGKQDIPLVADFFARNASATANSAMIVTNVKTA